MANRNRILSRRQTTQKHIAFWDDINEDLCRLRKKATAYGTSYSLLIFNLNKATWNGEKTVNDVPEDQQEPPSEEEVEAQVASFLQNQNPEEVLASGQA